MIRRLTALLAAIALLQAIAKPALACEEAHATEAVAQAPGSSHADMDSDCPESDTPAKPDHSSECLTSCMSMVSCSTLSFEAEVKLEAVAHTTSPILFVVPAPPADRAFPPDRPPPRA